MTVHNSLRARRRKRYTTGKNGYRKVRVFANYGGRCACCGSRYNLTVDHIVPVCIGGSSRLDNLQLLCRSCNLKKGSRIIRYRKYSPIVRYV